MYCCAGRDQDVLVTSGWDDEQSTADPVDRDGRIQQVRREGVRLAGQIPTEIGMLTSMREFCLIANKLTGEAH